MINRRGLIIGLISFVASPAIVRVSSLMPIKAVEPDFTLDDYWKLLNNRMKEYEKKIADCIMNGDNFHFGGLKFFVENDEINLSNLLQIFMVDK